MADKNAKSVGVVAIEGAIDRAGAIAYWTLASDDVAIDVLAEAARAAGVPSALLPTKGPTVEDALKAAVRASADARLLARDFKAGDWDHALVLESEERSDLDYATKLRIRLRAETQDSPAGVEFDRYTDGSEAMRAAIREAFRHNLCHFASKHVSAWLTKCIKALDAVALRDTGGMYFIPPANLPYWRCVTAAIKAVTTHTIYEIKAVVEGSATAAIMDAIRAEVDRDLREIEREIMPAGVEWTVRALATKSATIRKIVAKLAGYESLMAVKLIDMHSRAAALRTRISVLSAGKETAVPQDVSDRFAAVDTSARVSGDHDAPDVSLAMRALELDSSKAEASTVNVADMGARFAALEID